MRAPSLDCLADLGRAALSRLPRAFRDHVADIALQVTDLPDDETCADLGLESPYDILGLYEGVDLTQKSVFDPAPGIDRIYLYRLPILHYWCESDEDLANIVTHVVIHEIGHHFGLSDAAMEMLEATAESDADG